MPAWRVLWQTYHIRAFHIFDLCTHHASGLSRPSGYSVSKNEPEWRSLQPGQVGKPNKRHEKHLLREAVSQKVTSDNSIFTSNSVFLWTSIQSYFKMTWAAKDDWTFIVATLGSCWEFVFSSKKDVGWSVVKSEAIPSQRLKQILIGKQWKICGRSGHLSRCECALVLMREQGLAGEGRARSAKPSPDERSLKTKGEKSASWI